LERRQYRPRGPQATSGTTQTTVLCRIVLERQAETHQSHRRLSHEPHAKPEARRAAESSGRGEGCGVQSRPGSELVEGEEMMLLMDSYQYHYNHFFSCFYYLYLDDYSLCECLYLAIAFTNFYSGLSSFLSTSSTPSLFAPTIPS